MAEFRPVTLTAWEDAYHLVEDDLAGGDPHAIYARVQAGLTAVRAAYMGTGCLTHQGRVYLGLPAVPRMPTPVEVPFSEEVPRGRG